MERLQLNSPGTLDNESIAELVLPGLYCIVKLKGDTKYGMKSDNFLYFRWTIHLVYIGDYKRRKKETIDIKRKLTYS